MSLLTATEYVKMHELIWVSSFFQAVKGSGKMRFNKNELSRLAAQPSHKFEKEGVLFIKEKQEGFFLRKSESKLICFIL